MSKYSFKILDKADIKLIVGGITKKDIEHIQEQMNQVADNISLSKIDNAISPPDLPLFTKYIEENKPPVKKYSVKQQ